MILSVTPNPCVDKTVFLPEMAVGRKNVCTRASTVPGGKGNNVARAVKALGERSAALVLVGGPAGKHVVEMITKDDRVTCHPVWIEQPTRTITTVLEEEAHRQTPLFEPGPKVDVAERELFIATVVSQFASTTILTLNGTVPDPMMQDCYARIITEARASGVPVILDSHGPELEMGLLAEPYMVKPNEAEASELVGFPIDSDDARWRAVDYFHDRGVKIVVLSLGPGGVFASDGSERLQVVPPAIEEVNAVGSGDSLVAGIAVGLHRGWTFEKTITWGVSAGTANAMSWDIGHFTMAEVESIADRVVVSRH
jgi:tagatose 6-phosphate kinase